jgi:hypothetical protein
MIYVSRGAIDCTSFVPPISAPAFVDLDGQGLTALVVSTTSGGRRCSTSTKTREFGDDALTLTMRRPGGAATVMAEIRVS